MMGETRELQRKAATAIRGAAIDRNSATRILAPEVGFEPTTNRLTADRSTTELLWNCRSADLRGVYVAHAVPRRQVSFAFTGAGANRVTFLFSFALAS